MTDYRCDVTTRVADIDQTVRGDGRHWERDARTFDVERAIPQGPPSRRVERDDVHVRSPTEQSSIHVGEAAMHAQPARRLAMSHLLPLLGTCASVDCVGDCVSGEVHHTADDNRCCLKRCRFRQRITANLFQLRDVRRVYLRERRESIAGQCAVVRRPVSRKIDDWRSDSWWCSTGRREGDAEHAGGGENETMMAHRTYSVSRKNVQFYRR